jgi:hypothetical protein
MPKWTQKLATHMATTSNPLTCLGRSLGFMPGYHSQAWLGGWLGWGWLAGCLGGGLGGGLSEIIKSICTSSGPVLTGSGLSRISNISALAGCLPLPGGLPGAAWGCAAGRGAPSSTRRDQAGQVGGLRPRAHC